MKILDMFASNGSTYFDKEFFKNKVVKNDIRKGEFKVLHQTIKIEPDEQIDYLITKYDLIGKKYDLVYMDPPHLAGKGKGIMFEKYTSLSKNWDIDLDNMFYNASQLSNIAILKWNTIDIGIKEVLKIAEKYFYITFGNKRGKKNETYFITLIKMEHNE